MVPWWSNLPMWHLFTSEEVSEQTCTFLLCNLLIETCLKLLMMHCIFYVNFCWADLRKSTFFLHSFVISDVATIAVFMTTICLTAQLVIGGPFDLHIERILRNQASSMSSPVVSACDPGVQGIVKGFGPVNGRPCQFCDICIQIKKDLDLVWHWLSPLLYSKVVLNYFLS